MSRPDIEAIRNRENKATQGPWKHNKDGIITQTKHITRDVWVIPKNIDDITFIANARTDIPDLLDYIEKLETAIKEVTDPKYSSIAMYYGSVHGYVVDKDRFDRLTTVINKK